MTRCSAQNTEVRHQTSSRWRTSQGFSRSANGVKLSLAWKDEIHKRPSIVNTMSEAKYYEVIYGRYLRVSVGLGPVSPFKLII